ncbi:DUF2163 domain-containing protein [uncultured Parasphingorhabdus sp.]|uniref:DUF2163 domain-containing protein n=1 Tax=uncultured Parasphingorhabdus sp. TaxID=2709694 RepID=UPI0030DA3A50|tara:strand:+ start:26633 stop:27451 length:819 start_codon:yes stop_codon:yes gene_type:complete
MSLDWLDRDVTTGTYLWRLEREDGVALGFASHDRDLVIDGFRYRATPGMVPSSIALSDSLDIDNVEISGVVTSAAIAETDLDAGRWDGALLYISLVDWEQPDVEPLPLICGEFGEIVRSGDSFTVEMLGATSFLDEPIAPLTSPTCRAEFCDRQCKLSLHRHQREGRIITISGDEIGIDEVGDAGADFAFGSLRFLDGPNCGLSYAIVSGQGDAVRLADQPVQPVAPGARVLLTEGCNKNFATCRDRFANSFNFRGEPYLPGNDLLTRYRGA